MLMKKVKLFFTVLVLSVCALAYGQNITVKGTVSDASTGEPVPFASLQLKGTMTGTSTDANGEYSISVPTDGILVFSSVGYTTQEVAVNGKTTINVSLASDAEFLDETIVVAYGYGHQELLHRFCGRSQERVYRKENRHECDKRSRGHHPGSSDDFVFR